VLWTLSSERCGTTLFSIFTSDNGGLDEGLARMLICPKLMTAGNNYAVQGSRNTFWEGGIRNPAIISGGHVDDLLHGTLYESLISSSD